jgi:hypothetical protein
VQIDETPQDVIVWNTRLPILDDRHQHRQTRIIEIASCLFAEIFGTRTLEECTIVI